MLSRIIQMQSFYFVTKQDSALIQILGMVGSKKAQEHKLKLN
jgi:hypothetical protein